MTKKELRNLRNQMQKLQSNIQLKSSSLTYPWKRNELQKMKSKYNFLTALYQKKELEIFKF